MIKVSNTSPQVLSPTASDPIHKEVREARVTHDGTILPSLKHANDYDYNQLDDKIDALSATSSTSLSVLQVAVDTLDTRLDTAEPKITSLQSDMTAEKAKIVTLQADNTTNKENITALQSGKADKLMATNLVTNGDFSNGTTGWNTNGTVVNGEIILDLATNTQLERAIVAPSGNKYYFSCKSRVGTATTSCQVYLRNASNQNIAGCASRHIDASTMTRQSAIWQPNENGVKLQTVRNGTSGTYIMDDFIFINLTETFGAGNEPTLAEMDLLMSQFSNSWFNGTQELLSLKAIQKELSSKADKVQEAWITPTLTNGATGTAKYMKDSMGFVHVRLSLTGCVTSQSCFNLPSVYRPSEVIYGCHNTNSSTVLGFHYIDTFGGFVQSAGNGNIRVELMFKAG